MNNLPPKIILDDLSHTFIIAEAGSNWKAGTYDEDLNRARALIKVAARAGADAVKFQTYKPKTTYVSDAGESTYLAEHGLNDNMEKIFEYLSMPYDMIPELSKYAEDEKIIFMSTPFSIEDAKAVDPYVLIHKVASFEINHIRLVEFLAHRNKPLLISTGASTYEEIDFAVNLVKRNNNSMIALMQCTSKYPCTISGLNLSVIPQMKARYNLPVGFSDHSIDPVLAPVLAVGFGATIIEKHFTLDRNLLGPDHPFALVPDELKLMVKSIREAELARGSGKKEILSEEIELRRFATRSIQSIKDIFKGEILREGINFEILRPGNRIRGIEPRFLSNVEGKKATKNIMKGEGITEFE